MIVVIDPRTLMRDCLVRGLSSVCKDHAVLAFTSVAEWLGSAPAQSGAAVVLLCSQGRIHADGQAARDLSRLLDGGTHIPVIVSDAEDAEYVIAALKFGARGYIPTSVTLDVAVQAIRIVESGGSFVPAGSLISLMYPTEPAARQVGQVDRLFTARQAEVLRVLRQGKSNKQIASELNMQEATVKVHVRNLMRKLKASNRTQLAFLTSGLFSR
jgi:DNA-binding NarL/FixJ family response regulator